MIAGRREFVKTAALFGLIAACNPDALWTPKPRPVGPEFFGHMVQGDWVQDDGTLCCPVTVYFGLLRLWDSRAVWWKMEQDTTALEANILYAERVDAQVMFTFGEPPVSACYPNSKVPQPSAWAAFVRQTVTQAAGRVKYWELWNEPAVTGYWDGTTEQLVEQSRVAYEIIKELQPDAVVLSPSMVQTEGYGAFTDRYLAGGESSDVIAFHAYADTPDAITPVIESLRASMRKYGVNKPIWNTEFAVVPKDSSLRNQYMEDAFRLQYEAGVQGAVWNAEVPGAEDYTDGTMQRIADSMMGKPQGVAT